MGVLDNTGTTLTQCGVSRGTIAGLNIHSGEAYRVTQAEWNDNYITY